MTSGVPRTVETALVAAVVVIGRIAGMSYIDSMACGIFLFAGLIFLHWDGGAR